MSPRVTIAAVLIAGLTAGFTVSPIILVATLLMVVFLANGLYRQGDASLATGDWAAFSPTVARQLDACIALLTDGVARRALLEVAVAARSLMSSAGTLLDRPHERATRDHVERLVEASCASAVELDRIDEALFSDIKIGEDARDRLTSVRRVLLLRLTNASDALRQLYVTGLTNTSDASDRVAELTSELTADGHARRAALAELSQLLDAASKR